VKARGIAATALAAAVAAACLRESMPFAALAFGGCDGTRPVMKARLAVERFVPRGERVTFLRNDMPNDPSQVCRSICLSLAWAAGAGNVDEKRSLDGLERYVYVAPVAIDPEELAKNPKYRKLGDGASGRIWVREGAPAKPPEDGGREMRDAGIAAVARDRGRSLREALELVPPLLVACALLAVGLGRAPSAASVACAVAVFSLNALFALSHSFTGPCGTGVFGGRAKALVESGWNLATLADPGLGEYFQCAYPPLQALVTAAGYALSGACGDWLAQAGPPIYLASAFLAMDGMRCDGRGAPGFATARRMLLFAACATEPMVHAAGNFCAEPLAMLAAACGWAAVRRGSACGWVAIGLAAFAKNEAVFYVPAVAAAEAAAGRFRFRMREAAALGCGLAPAVLWHIGCRFAGASLYDYAAPWQCDPARAFAAVRALVHEIAFHPWRYAFIGVAMACAVRARRADGEGGAGAALRKALAPLAFFAVCAAGICFAFSLSRSPDFAWHLSCMPRLLAPVAALALAISTAPRETVCACNAPAG